MDVLDRTALILNIFARRAKTAEGKLQVELAMLKYRLPRLAGWARRFRAWVRARACACAAPAKPSWNWTAASFAAASKTSLENSRSFPASGPMRRARREKQGETIVALVGYTNAGKSTLLNAPFRRGRLCGG